MPVQILLSQSGKAPGTPGVSRDDFDVGTDVVAQAIGGPYSRYQWSFVSKAIDIEAAQRASSAYSAAQAATTTVSPINVRGVYILTVAVDSGSGLGAGVDDVATIEFYAGLVGSASKGPLNADPAELPRRPIGFREQREFNVADAIDPTGNPEGWSREWYRWFALLQRQYEGKSWAQAGVDINAAVATMSNKFNVASVAWVSTGIVEVTFERPMPEDTYTIITSAYGAPGGYATARDKTTTGFFVERAGIGGYLVDASFTFDVKYTLSN